MEIFIGSDHAGFLAKEKIKTYLKETTNYIITDLGTNSTDSVDYPVFGERVARKVVETKDSLGIVVCGSGIGISIAANKVKGARCALVYTKEAAHLAKLHNNANIIALSGRGFEPSILIEFVEEFLQSEFEAGRHQRRVDMLNSL